MKDYLGPATSHKDLIDALDLWDRAFPATPRDYFEYAFLYDPAVEYRNIHLLRVEGKLVSSVLVTPRQLYWNGKTVPFGGIANVSTHPEFLKRGFSTRVLRKAIETMKAEHMPLSMLFTDINPFYERVGFQTLPRQTFVVDFGARPQGDPSVRVFDFERDFQTVRQIHAEFSLRWNGPLVRDEVRWRSQFRLKKQNTHHFLVRFAENRPVAYLRGKVEEKTANVMEFGALDNEAEHLLALSRELAIRSNRQKVQLTAPLGALWKESDACKVEVKTDTSVMFSILDPEFFGTDKVESLFPPERTLYWGTDSF